MKAIQQNLIPGVFQQASRILKNLLLKIQITPLCPGKITLPIISREMFSRRGAGHNLFMTGKSIWITITGCLVFSISTPAQTITTVAGTGTAGYSGDGGAATSAKVNLPTSVCPDIYGNIYIADRYNHRIRKIDANTGVITTIAGTGTSGFSGDGGPATSAQFNEPIGVIVATDGTIYVSDNLNHRIRKIDAAGIITTYAGTGVAGYLGDGGPATAARFNQPWGLALDKNNNLYIADRSNDRVRKIDYITGTITTVAGTGTTGYSGDAGPATSANFNKPISVAVDTALNLYIADENNHRVRKVTYATGIVNKIAGNGTAGYSGDGGAATSSSLNFPSGVGVDLGGNVYISDRTNQRLRKVNTSGIISTVAGTGTVGFSGDGGSATSALINYPRELFSDGSGNIYFADTDNKRIRKITYCNLPSIPTISASQNNFCSGQSTTLTIASGSLNAATDWQWYDQDCGVNNVGSGTSITVTPGSTTTYYVRGEGGCVTPYGCGNITINVLQTPAQPAGITGATAICEGSANVYTVPSVPGATGYTWTLPSGWTGTSTTTNISTTAGASGGTISVTADNSCGSSPAQTLPVNVDPLPTAVIIATGTTFCAGDSTHLDIVLSPGETIQWYRNGGILTGETDTSLTATLSGNYTAVVTNSSGCSAVSNSITLTVNSVPTASITADHANFCPGITSIVLTANSVPGATYSWLFNGTPITGATSSVYTATATGNYQVIITNTSGCSTTSAITALGTGSVSTFTLSAAATSFCEGSSVSMSTMAETGSSYTWYNGATQVAGPSTGLNNYNANAGGTYVVSVTNAAGCTTTSDSVTITEMPLPAAVISASTTSLCTGSSSLITATFVAGSTYEWFRNGVSLGVPTLGGNSMTATTDGNYYVIVDNGCSNTSNTVVIVAASVPSAAGAISGPITFCPGESLVFDETAVAGATSYHWAITPATAASIGSGQGTDEVVVNTTNQNFTLTVTPQNACGNGTAGSLSINVETTPGWCPGILFAANQTNVCAGSAVTFTNYTDASMYPGASPHWNFGAGASPATATGSGPHTVTYSSSGLKTVVLSYVDDFSGFTIDSDTKTDYVYVSGSVSTSAITGNSSVTCSSTMEPYSVVNTPGSVYSWTVPSGATILSGSGTNAILVNFNGNSGTVSVTETNATGCVGTPVSKSVTVTGGPVTSSITGNTLFSCSSVLENYSVVNTTGSTYVWTVPAGAVILSGDGTNTISVNFNGNSGVVSVTETNATGCTGSPVSINVNCSLGTGTVEADFSGISVYPNPVNQLLNIGRGSSEAMDIVIYDLNGQEVLTGTWAQSVVQVDVSGLSSGTYIGKAVSAGHLYHFKFIKQ